VLLSILIKYFEDEDIQKFVRAVEDEIEAQRCKDKISVVRSVGKERDQRGVVEQISSLL
jgi:hypothetical protein